MCTLYYHGRARAGANSGPELDCLANSNSNSGIGIGIELAFRSLTGIGIELELPVFELELNWNCHNWNWSQNCVPRIRIYSRPTVRVLTVGQWPTTVLSI